MRVYAHANRRTERGQALTEFGIVLPLLLLLVLGVIEFGYAIYRSLLIDALAREGSNLISRHTTLMDAETALRSAAPAAVPLNSNGCIILSVVKLGTGGSNANRPIVYQRYRFGSLSASSVLGNQPTGSYGPGPDYTANDADGDSSILIAGALPNGLTLSPGESVYVTEVFVNHQAVSPLANFGITLPRRRSSRCSFSPASRWTWGAPTSCVRTWARPSTPPRSSPRTGLATARPSPVPKRRRSTTPTSPPATSA
jgi:hypothetical protein